MRLTCQEGTEGKDDKDCLGSGQELKVGDEIQIIGLSRQQQYNGKIARLKSFCEEKGRWRVKLSSGKVLQLKPENIVAFDLERIAYQALLEKMVALVSSHEIFSRIKQPFLPANPDLCSVFEKDRRIDLYGYHQIIGYYRTAVQEPYIEVISDLAVAMAGIGECGEQSAFIIMHLLSKGLYDSFIEITVTGTPDECNETYDHKIVLLSESDKIKAYFDRYSKEEKSLKTLRAELPGATVIDSLLNTVKPLEGYFKSSEVSAYFDIHNFDVVNAVKIFPEEFVLAVDEIKEKCVGIARQLQDRHGEAVKLLRSKYHAKTNDGKFILTVVAGNPEYLKFASADLKDNPIFIQGLIKLIQKKHHEGNASFITELCKENRTIMRTVLVCKFMQDNHLQEENMPGHPFLPPEEFALSFRAVAANPLKSMTFWGKDQDGQETSDEAQPPGSKVDQNPC